MPANSFSKLAFTKMFSHPLQLRCGQMTLTFEPETTYLRYVRVGDHEVVRAIYGAVRDRNWNTVPARLSNLQVQSTPQSFALSFDVICQQNEIEFFWKGEITGDEQGKIIYRFLGEARTTFFRNRIGLCVLHPMLECAGKPCAVEKTDGAVQHGVFPKYIAPDQPFLSMRAITHEVAPGIQAEVRFDGDTFEMEDQRNWTDASFKTYSTPLERPFPVEIKKGTRVEQSVTISFPGQPRKILPVLLGRPPQFSISTTPVLPKPPIGLCAASHGQTLSDQEIQRLKRLALSHLRVDLRLADPAWPIRLRQTADQSRQLGTSLHIALHLSANPAEELKTLAHEIAAAEARVSLALVFHDAEPVTSESWARLAREILASANPNILIAAGTDAYFVELNRSRPKPDSVALPCYSINPQVHASDNNTLIENIATQPLTVESTQQFCPKAVVVSPITLRPRFNPDAAEMAPTDQANWPDRLPPEVDPRQPSLFAAGWTLGSLARLMTVGNVHSLTYYETTGWRGIMETATGSPPLFPSTPGMVYPVYHLFAALAGYHRLCPTHSSHPLQTEGLTLLDDKNRRRILVANLVQSELDLKIKTGTCQAKVRYLDSRNCPTALHEPESFASDPGQLIDSAAGKIDLHLLPHALAFVDIVA